MAQLGKLISKADSYDPLPYDSEVLEYQYDIYKNVWKQASDLRSKGELSRLGKNIQCPVVTIQGDYDPHLQLPAWPAKWHHAPTRTNDGGVDIPTLPFGR